MRRLLPVVAILFLAAVSIAGFKAKPIKSKPPEKFQARAEVGGVTLASDLLLSEKEQTEFFYRELNSSGIIPIRFAIFNNSQSEVLVPSDGIKLIGPDGKEIPAISPEKVAEAVLQGYTVKSGKSNPPVQVGAGPTVVDPRYDPSDPRYDPQIDPSNPRYDPRMDPTDPRYDPSDPRNRGYGNRRIEPGVGVVLNPPGTNGGNYDEITKRLIEKDFCDKAYSADPVMPNMKRDRFLYFRMDALPAGVKGFELHLPEGKGLPQGIKLVF
jgi:hypothetical protein